MRWHRRTLHAYPYRDRWEHARRPVLGIWLSYRGKIAQAWMKNDFIRLAVIHSFEQ